LKIREWQYAQSPPPAVPAVGEFVETFRKSFCPTVEKPAPVVTGLPEIIHFGFDKAELEAEAIEVLDEWAEYLSTNQERKVQIGGHADSVGDEMYNLVLSKKRADGAKQYLVEKGVGTGRISVAYYGEGEPVAPDDPVAGNRKNRRAEIKLLD
jgi:outer membrane protein OmpA-like peptidoglycan-associated protein